MTSPATMQPGDPRLTLTLAEVQRTYRDEQYAARRWMEGGSPADVARAVVHATLADAAARMAQVLVQQDAEVAG